MIAPLESIGHRTCDSTSIGFQKLTFQLGINKFVPREVKKPTPEETPKTVEPEDSSNDDTFP